MLSFFEEVGRRLVLGSRKLDARTTRRRARPRLEELEDRLVPTVLITEFPAPGEPYAITGGPKDSAFFTGTTGAISEMTFMGGYSFRPTNPLNATPYGVVQDQANLWALESIGKQSYLARYGQGSNNYPATGKPSEITADAVGNLWYIQQNPGALVEIDPNNPTAPVYYPVPDDANPLAITVAADGGIWIAASGPSGNMIDRLDPQTHLWATQSTGTYGAHAITATPFGVGFTLWDNNGNNAIGVLRYDSHTSMMSGFQQHAVPNLTNLSCSGITYGPDGNLWFTEHYAPLENGANVPRGRIGWASSFTGQYEGALPVTNANSNYSQPINITRGWTQLGNAKVDTSTLWFTDLDGYIGRIDIPITTIPIVVSLGVVPGNGVGGGSGMSGEGVVPDSPDQAVTSSLGLMSPWKRTAGQAAATGRSPFSEAVEWGGQSLP